MNVRGTVMRNIVLLWSVALFGAGAGKMFVGAELMEVLVYMAFAIFLILFATFTAVKETQNIIANYFKDIRGMILGLLFCSTKCEKKDCCDSGKFEKGDRK